MSFDEKDALHYQAIQEGQEWGRSRDLIGASAWFGAEVDSVSNYLPKAGQAHNPQYYGEHIGRVESARIVLLDTALWKYLLDINAAMQLVQSLIAMNGAAFNGFTDSHLGKTASPRTKRLLYAIDRTLSLHAMQRERLN